jgi:hypothetical protein
MNDSLVRKFCESRRRWLIVATATGLLALVGLLPTVDDYFDKRTSRSELADQLATARLTAESLPAYEKQAEGVRAELEALEVRTVDAAGVAKFRSRLVDLVRESGCQIRRIDVGAPTRRPWSEQDDALAEVARPAAGATPFVLERRSVVLAVDGAMPAVHDLLDRLEKERTLSHPHRLQMQGASAGGETVTMELELWLFALARTAA